jgi:hypothetical protein
MILIIKITSHQKISNKIVNKNLIMVNLQEIYLVENQKKDLY